MNFEQLRRRVERAERLVEGRGNDTRSHWQELQDVWRRSWTPMRIVVVGLGMGFISGRSDPKVAIGGIAAKLGAAPKLLQLISTFSALFTAKQAQDASEQAERAADNAEEVAAGQEPDQAPQVPTPVDSRSVTRAPSRPAPHVAEPAQPTAPRPAEAATDVSER